MTDGPGQWSGVAGVTVLRVGAPAGRRPGPAVVRLAVGHGQLHRRAEPGTSTVLGRPDGLDAAEALAFARRLARCRPTTGAAEADGGSGPPPGLPALLGLQPGPAGITALRARWSRTETDRLRVPIGLDEHGRPVALDLKESAQGGHGPHGLCVGATGSGKSELLRSLVLGLAASHSSLELNLVLVDFKGGATFLDFAALPHVSAVITNLADELTLADRMAAALTGEIYRRQELLRAAGNLTSVADYAAARRAGAALRPLPALLVVVDEFSELLAQRPELIDLLVMIGRIGRSLGLHLLLASQRLDEGRIRGLESHLSYRIALRTFSAAESRAVLGVPDAHRLTAPGSAFLAAGSDELVRFRATFVSGPDTPPPIGPPHASVRPRAVLFRAWSAPADPPRFTPPPGRGPDPGRRPSSVVSTVIAAMTGLGPPAHRVWLPPLDVPPPLDEVLGPVATVPGRGLCAAGRPPLRVPYGVVDRPLEQRRDHLVFDLTGAAGQLAVVGGPRSGKSTALATVVLGLALTSTPAELGVHVLDFGGGALGQLAALPHVGSVADGQQPDLVRRTIAELGAVLARRERMFRECGITSVTEFRARRADGAFPDEPATDVLLVVDGHLTLRAEFDDMEAGLLSIAAKGLSYGVHLAMSANRWTELRPALRDLLGERIELRLGDPSESEVDRRSAAAVPARPGHGLASDGSPAVLAAPRTSDPESGTAALAEAIARAWPGPGFAPVRLLPELVDVHALPPADGVASTGIPLGVDERLDRIDVDFAAEPHLLCFGDAESGKTGLLRLLAHGICARFGPDQARIVIVDPRRTLLGTVGEPHLLANTGTRRGDGRGRAGDRRIAPSPAAGAAGLGAVAAGSQLVERARAVSADRRLRPRRTRRRGASAAAARGVPAAGQGRRSARCRRAALRGRGAGPLRPDSRAAAGARRTRDRHERQPGRGAAGRVGETGRVAARSRDAGGPPARCSGDPAGLAPSRTGGEPVSGGPSRVAVQVGSATVRIAGAAAEGEPWLVAELPDPAAGLDRLLSELVGTELDELVVVHPPSWPEPRVAVLARGLIGLAGQLRTVPVPLAAAGLGPRVVLDVGHTGAEVTRLARDGTVQLCRSSPVGGALLDEVLADRLRSALTLEWSRRVGAGLVGIGQPACEVPTRRRVSAAGGGPAGRGRRRGISGGTGAGLRAVRAGAARRGAPDAGAAVAAAERRCPASRSGRDTPDPGGRGAPARWPRRCAGRWSCCARSCSTATRCRCC